MIIRTLCNKAERRENGNLLKSDRPVRTQRDGHGLRRKTHA